MRKVKWNNKVLKIVLSIILFISSFFLGKYSFIALATSYGIIGYEIYLNAFRNILKGKIFDENFLMIIATIGAFCIGKTDEAVMVIMLFQIGEYLSDLAVDRSKRSIIDLMDLRSDTANILENGIPRKADARQLQVGDLILVKTGEKIPLDGEVIEGDSEIDTSALTGESVPRKIKVGDEALSGYINRGSIITIKVTKLFENSAASKIIELIEKSGEKKTNTEKFITKFSKVYTPLVVVAALVIVLVPTLFGASFDVWLYRSLVFLVISCPCALVISVPLGFFCGIGRASKEGVLVKGSNELEQLCSIKTIAFDKTGTITEGVFVVTDVQSVNGDHEKLLEQAAYCEYYSNHPIAKSILKAYGKPIPPNLISDYLEIEGRGIRVQIDGEQYLVGNHSLMIENDVYCREVESIGTTIYMACRGTYIGYLVISDQIKKEAYFLKEELAKEGIYHTVILSGDHEIVVKKISEEIGIEKYFFQMLPRDKVDKIEEMKKSTFLAFIGDGLNDVPVIKLADVGIAMGGIGSDATIEAADVVIMRDDISKIAQAVRISKITKKIVTFNIAFALFTKTFILLLGVFGFASIWLAVFADVGVTLLSIANALRIVFVKIK